MRMVLLMHAVVHLFMFACYIVHSFGELV